MQVRSHDHGCPQSPRVWTPGGNIAGSEAELVSSSELASHEREYHRLRGVLEEAAVASRLPDQPGGRDALNALLLHVSYTSGERWGRSAPAGFPWSLPKIAANSPVARVPARGGAG